MKYCLIIIGILFAIKLTGQDLKKLEEDLMQTDVTKLKKLKKKAEAIYKIDRYNEVATSWLVEAYRITNHLDLIPKLFKRLKNIDPNNPIPYILSAKYQYDQFSISDTSKLTDMKVLIKIDSMNCEVYRQLGCSYYDLFLEAVDSSKKKYADFYARQTKKYFIKTIKLNQAKLIPLSFPIIQTSYYISDTSDVNQYRYTPIRDTNSYFPFNTFSDLKKDWEMDYHVNLIYKAIDHRDHRYSENLRGLKEPIIFNQKNKSVYRFLFLHSMCYPSCPLSIRIEKNDTSYSLHYARLENSDNKREFKEEQKVLSKDQWNKFLSLIEIADYWNLSTNEIVPKNEARMDGARYIIEAIDNGKYHVVDRWSPYSTTYDKFAKCAGYLIELSGLKIF